MGGAARPPMSGGTGQPSPQGGGQTMQQGSDYYRHLLDNQRQNVANVPAVQSAQAQPQTPPNRPGPTLPGFGGQQQGQAGTGDGRYQGAYDAYMQQFGGGGQGIAQQPPAPPAGQQKANADYLDNYYKQQYQNSPYKGTPAEIEEQRLAAGQKPTPRPNRPGIRMGGGYANRT